MKKPHSEKVVMQPGRRSGLTNEGLLKFMAGVFAPPKKPRSFWMRGTYWQIDKAGKLWASEDCEHWRAPTAQELDTIKDFVDRIEEWKKHTLPVKGFK